jgi:hypothetical protein
VKDWLNPDWPANIYSRIGVPGTVGFGAGICPAYDLPSGFTGLSGYTNPTDANYGNYQYTDGSVMVFVPKFYHRIHNASNPTNVAYDPNDVDIKGVDIFNTTAAANTAGYALHRAFIDGGVEKSGFFVDKYLVSKVATGTGYTASSILNGLPLSTAAAHNPVADITASPANYYYSMVDAPKGRGITNGAYSASSIFHCCSVFIYSALALLSLAHGQAAASTTNCAWYDGTLAANFPKGCNNNALKDINDTAVIWETDGYSNCGKTGSAGYGGGAGNVFAKSTHNGQNCGVADLNGLMWEVAIGLTYVSGAAKYYIAKQATAMKSFTSGSSGATDHWGATGVAAMMDEYPSPMVPASGFTSAMFWGNGANQVLDESVSGNGWLRTGSGCVRDVNSIHTTGSNLFGLDYYYQANTNELCVVRGGVWYDGSGAGVWGVSWNDYRSDSVTSIGGRGACYPL